MRRRSITVALFYVISPPSTCSHSGNVCKRVRERERERETLSLAFPGMTHRSAEKPSIHLLSHSPILIPIFPLRKEKSHSWRRQLQNGRASILFASILPQEALSWVGGRLLPVPLGGPEMDGTMRRVLCRRAHVWYTFDDSSSCPQPPFASPSSNVISKRLTKNITMVQSASYRDRGRANYLDHRRRQRNSRCLKEIPSLPYNYRDRLKKILGCVSRPLRPEVSHAM